MNIQQIKEEFEWLISHATNGLRGNWDGLKEWNALKDRYDVMDANVEINWSDWVLGSEIADFRNRLLVELPEHNQDGSINEASHFIIQCVRIASKNEFSIRRLMQIAFNIGQMNAVGYDAKYLAEFAALRLGAFETYVKY